MAIANDVIGFEEVLVEVWRQAFAENAKAVVLGTERYTIVRTSKRKLRQIDFKDSASSLLNLILKFREEREEFES